MIDDVLAKVKIEWTKQLTHFVDLQSIARGAPTRALDRFLSIIGRRHP